MAINFPTSGTHTVDGITYTFDSSKSVWNPAGVSSSGSSSSVTVYPTAADLPLTGVTDGDQAFVTSTKYYYIYKSGWFAILLAEYP